MGKASPLTCFPSTDTGQATQPTDLTPMRTPYGRYGPAFDSHGGQMRPTGGGKRVSPPPVHFYVTTT
jgi:hypothetical protein